MNLNESFLFKLPSSFSHSHSKTGNVYIFVIANIQGVLLKGINKNF